MQKFSSILLNELPCALKKQILRIWRILFAGRYKKALWYLAAVFVFMKYQSNRRKVQRIAQNTKNNQSILEFISPEIESFRPSFLYPFSLLQIIRGNQEKKKHHCVFYEKQPFKLSDGGELSLDWFPLNYNNFPKETPIVVFLLGSFGTSEDAYAKEFCLMIQKKNWRMVIVNRRGWDMQPLKNEKFIHQDELQDFYEAIVELKNIYESKIFLIGVSAGSAHGSRLVAKYRENLPIDAFVSISNPYNIAKLTFQLQYSFVGVHVSRFLCNGYKKLYEYHKYNPHFQSLISK